VTSSAVTTALSRKTAKKVKNRIGIRAAANVNGTRAEAHQAIRTGTPRRIATRRRNRSRLIARMPEMITSESATPRTGWNEDPGSAKGSTASSRSREASRTRNRYRCPRPDQTDSTSLARSFIAIG
jgi:hypothetical protein